MKFIQGKTQNAAATLDIESELWARVCGNQPVFSDRAPAKSWLYKVAGNLAVDYHRARCRDLLAIARTGAEGPVDIGFDFSPDDDIDDSPEAAALRADADLQRNIQLVGLMRRAQLDRQSIDILLRRLTSDQSLEEIAEEINLPLSNVKARLYRAVDKLKEARARSGT